MYRVVLIDDENIIVEGLRRVIKWADCGCEVVGTASGAEEGAALNPEIAAPYPVHRHPHARSRRPDHAGGAAQ